MLRKLPTHSLNQLVPSLEVKEIGKDWKKLKKKMESNRERKKYITRLT